MGNRFRSTAAALIFDDLPKGFPGNHFCLLESQIAVVKDKSLNIAMLCIHSSPIGKVGTKDTGGMSIYVRELARELGGQDHRVDIFTHRNTAHHPLVMDLSANVQLVHLGKPGTASLEKHALISVLSDLFDGLTSFKTARSRHYDLVHSHYWLSGPLGLWAQDIWNIPHLITFHTLGAVKNGLGMGALEPEIRVNTEQLLVDTCSRILSATDREKGQLHYYYRASLNKIGVVPCGVNLKVFVPLERSEARKRLNVGREDNVVLYVGRFDRLKGLDRLLDAVSMVRYQQKVTLLIVGGDGNGSVESMRLQSLCETLKIDDQVRFLGAIDHQNLPLYYSAADALIVPSLYESFSLVTLEALACGTPVLATNVGATDHLIQRGKTGYIIPNTHPQGLASGLQKLLSRKPDTRYSREAIRDSVRAFSWPSVASALLQEYRACL